MDYKSANNTNNGPCIWRRFNSNDGKEGIKK